MSAKFGTPTGELLNVVDRPAQAGTDRLELHERENLRQAGPARNQPEQRLQCTRERVVGGQRPVADANRHRQRPTVKDGFDKRGEAFEIGAQHHHVVSSQGRICHEDMPEGVTQHFELADLAMARMNLQASVGGIEPGLQRGPFVEANLVLESL